MTILDTNGDGHIDMTEFLVAVRVSTIFLIQLFELEFKLSGKMSIYAKIGFIKLSAILFATDINIRTKTRIKGDNLISIQILGHPQRLTSTHGQQDICEV